MYLYHGTDLFSAENILKQNIKLDKGDISVDNGQGFYTTHKFEFAKKRARMRANSNKVFNGEDNIKSKPAVVKIDFNLEKACLDQEISIKKIAGCNYDWQEFVFLNRIGPEHKEAINSFSNNHNLDFKYDCIINETADCGISGIISNFIKNNNLEIDHSFSSLIKTIKRGTDICWALQISFHTNEILKYIKVLEIINIK